MSKLQISASYFSCSRHKPLQRTREVHEKLSLREKRKVETGLRMMKSTARKTKSILSVKILRKCITGR